MEKHKYTPVRLTPEEKLALLAFMLAGDKNRAYIGEQSPQSEAFCRQLYRLGFLDKSRIRNAGYFYILSRKGREYLNRPRIKIKFRRDRLGRQRITYKILNGVIYGNKSYDQITQTLFLKVI